MTIKRLKRFLVPPPNRLVLLVSASRREQRDVTIFRIGERWNVLATSNLQTAQRLMRKARIEVILYDQDLPGTDWRTGVRGLLRESPPTCLVLLSYVPNDMLWRDLLRCGGCCLASKPMDRTSVVRMVNGLFRLVDDVMPTLQG